MKARYVILRKPSEAATRERRGFSAETEALPAAVPPTVEVDELEPRAAADLSRKSFVDHVAPAIPMNLVAPVATEAATASPSSITWGIRAVGADTSPFTGDGVVVAVLDTGIDPSHPAFAGINLERKNFTSGSDDDQHGHGTHCAGTIFGRDVDGARIGVARGVKKALIGKVLGPSGGGSDQVAQAIQWAVSKGANVISMSLGIDFPGYVEALENEGVPTEVATSMALEGYRANIGLFESLAKLLAAQNAFMGATILIAAAGNESRRNLNADFEIAVSPPAVSEGFVSVAALADGSGGFTVAPFSNVGARVAGPGVDVISAKRGGGFISMSGTSMATPHIAGVAALWAQKLAATSQLNAKLLDDKLVGTATLTGLKSGFVPRHVGAGLAKAPQN